LNLEPFDITRTEKKKEKGSFHQTNSSVDEEASIQLDDYEHLFPSEQIDSVNNKNKEEKDCFHQSNSNVDRITPTRLDDNENLCNVKKENKMASFVFQAKKLYGRDRHISTIMETFNRAHQSKNSSEMILISGYSGAGKSALVSQAQKSLSALGGSFLCGKFDHFRQMEPLSAIITAFTEFCDEIITGDAERFHQTKISIQQKLGIASVFLANIIPNLNQIVQVPDTEPVDVGGMEAQHMLKYIFQLFVRAISKPSQTRVLFLDDLQWADPLSLDLIESLVTDIENGSLLFIGCYRDNEVDEGHPLATKLRSIEKRQVQITNIYVGDLNKEDTNELIADLIQSPPNLTQSLSNAVYLKTSGNVLYILQFLSSIYAEGYLRFSLETKQWQWDTLMINSKIIATNAMELSSHKILRLPKQTQNALKLIACLGYCCEEFVIYSMAAGNDTGNIGCVDLIASLEIAVAEGLIGHMGSCYKFAHDQIQLAAYSLIPKKHRACVHLWIGNQVWANTSASPEKALFIAVGQLNKGAEAMKDEHERIELAGLNLLAAQKSKSLAAFLPAAFYLNTGISLLDKTSWVDQYNLSLQLFSACAEAEFCTGHFDEMNKKLQEVFSNARCLDDELYAFFTLTSSLMAQGKSYEASEAGLLVLSQLGEAFPRHSDMKSIIVVEFAKVKSLCEGKTNGEILALKAMDDGHKIAAMRLMYFLAHSSFLGCHDMYALIVLRMVQTSMNHGICDESAFGFCALGIVMGCMFKDTDGGRRFGQLALHFLKIKETNKCFSGVITAVYTYIHPNYHHYRESLEPLEKAYESGMINGDVAMAMSAAAQICFHEFQCGEELAKVETTTTKYRKLMMAHKQENFCKFLLPYSQAIRNLMGYSDDPENLIGELMDQEELLKEVLKSKHMRVAAVIYYIRSWLAYMFGNYEIASKMMKERQAISLFAVPPSLSCAFIFTEGLISFAMSHEFGEEKWSVLAFKSVEEFKIFALHAPSNCEQKLLLLQAESAFLEGEYYTAALRYDDAINTASKNGFIQDQAIACERAGIFHSRQGNISKAFDYVSQAHNAYFKWGAKCKADHLNLQYQNQLSNVQKMENQFN